LTVIDAIAASCDVYFYQLGKELGVERFADYSRACGFGRKTGIDLADELSGLIPDIDYYDNRYGEGRWPSSLILNLSIGQGEVLVTPLQAAVFYAALANGGRLMRPHALHSLITPEGEILKDPEEIGRLPFSESTVRVLDSALIDAVNGELGTAHRAQVVGTVVAGKTGTAQNPHGNEHAWFCAFAPAHSPRIAVACIVENAGHGGSVAAPIVGSMIERYLRSTGEIRDSLPPGLIVQEATDVTP
jgi:penicillin-binding protein 2